MKKKLRRLKRGSIAIASLLGIIFVPVILGKVTKNFNSNFFNGSSWIVGLTIVVALGLGLIVLSIIIFAIKDVIEWVFE